MSIGFSITLAHSLGIKAIAEDVETSHQITYLKNLGCDAAQGYFLAKPLNIQLVESILISHKKPSIYESC
ncbi:MAG: EAL domain-containing protein [Waterburya sp.]